MEFLDGLVQPVIEFVRAHPEFATVIVFLIAFGECFALISFLVPGTVFFVGFGALAGSQGLSILPLALAAAVGAASGFWTSYLIGQYLGPRAEHHWPFRGNPETLRRGHAFFERWGAPGIFIGHFFGPVRAIIALVAGIVNMPQLPFHIANIAASTLWGFAMFYGSGEAGKILSKMF